MDARSFFDRLMAAAKVHEVEEAMAEFRAANDGVTEEPIAGRPNNRGAVEVATDTGRSAIERVTNAQDAVLELEHSKHNGKPDCRSPRDAAAAWLSVPARRGLAGLSEQQRRELAANVVIRLQDGDGSWQSRLLTVHDKGIGILPAQMQTTILSLNEDNKIEKHYLAGTYGQGGSSTFAFCRYALIASRKYETDEIGFTVVWYRDLPPDRFKTGRYVYLARHSKPLATKANAGDFDYGTIVRHFGYDLSSYSAALGPRSLYGVLQRVLFDPVMPVRIENEVHQWRNRTIKGARNALNGAVDDGDDVEAARGPGLSHDVAMFNVDLGDHGEIGIEYWVLAMPAPKDGKKPRGKPADAFVDSTRPIILTNNGQNQGELLAKLIQKDADLPFLHGRLICHINCDRLTPGAKRNLFSSTREQSREGHLQTRIREELIRSLVADDELTRLNEEAREQSLKQTDEQARKAMRKEVARLLRLSGVAVEEAAGRKEKEEGSGRDRDGNRKREKLAPIPSAEPPTYIKIVWERDKPIPFYANQRRYLRIETDAGSEYHTGDAATSRINVVPPDHLKEFGRSPLKDGRMRIGIECREGATVGATGNIRVELYRKGLAALSDERQHVVVAPPEPKNEDAKTTLPDFEVIPVDGPEESDWSYICGDQNDSDVSRHASGAIMNKGTLHVYYSTRFPRFAAEFKKLEAGSPALAQAFQKKYELWLAVHSFLMEQKDGSGDSSKLEPELANEIERQERCRLATIAAMMAGQEIKSASIGNDPADAA